MLNFGGVGMKFSPVLELEPRIFAHRTQEILHSSIIIILIIASSSLYTHRRVHLRPLALERLLVFCGVVHLLFWWFGEYILPESNGWSPLVSPPEFFDFLGGGTPSPPFDGRFFGAASVLPSHSSIFSRNITGRSILDMPRCLMWHGGTLKIPRNYTPWRSNMDTPKMRFGRWFSFSIRWFFGSSR